MVLKSKRDFYNGKVQAAKGNQKELFKLVNTVFHNNSKQSLPSHDSLEQLSNMFSDFYVTKIEKIRADISSTYVDDIVMDGALASDEPCLVTIPLLEFYPTNIDEINELIKASPDKSCDLDPIQFIVLWPEFVPNRETGFVSIILAINYNCHVLLM